jgi:hypothetical protein
VARSNFKHRTSKDFSAQNDLLFFLFSLMKKETKKSRLLNKFLKSTTPAGGFTQTPHCFKNVG